tara:strand:+ start:1038 stop:1373 length:336 start_codon:yes stop_codon:yes gene_type:complete
MSYDDWDYEADIRDEYRAEEAYEALEEERLANCKCDMWAITDEGIVDVEAWEHKNGEFVKMETPLAVIEIKCDFCGKTNCGRVPLSEILTLLRNEFEHTGGLHINEDGWGR